MIHKGEAIPSGMGRHGQEAADGMGRRYGRSASMRHTHNTHTHARTEDLAHTLRHQAKTRLVCLGQLSSWLLSGHMRPEGPLTYTRPEGT